VNTLRSKQTGFTLLELLVVAGISSVLIGILLPALSASRHAAMALECKTKLRTVTMNFIEFADVSNNRGRGDSDRYGPRRFRLEDFQESIYQIDEFWAGTGGERVAMKGAEQSMMCPAGAGHLERRASIPCSSGAIGPQANVSVAFNKRLETRTRLINNRPIRATAYPTDKILQYPDVPLVLDADGGEAAGRDLLPYYTAPPIVNDKAIDIYEDGRYWFPAFRHRNQSNVGFVGGHVLSSSHPGTEPWWKWDYQPDP
jgi:prepilin-type N-terminal cleavage/methylation domain-containing protein/prepilin-type processing-associated H-X9-DG protein